MKNIFDKIKIHSSTYVMVLIGLLAGYLKNIFIILLIVLVHEVGHVFFFLLFRIEIDSIVIYPFGGVSKVNKKIHERIYKDILISLGGIIFQIFLYIVFILLYKENIIVDSTYNMFVTYNRSIILFNLIPIIPLDGSKLFLSVFSKFLSYRDSYVGMIIISIVSFIVFIMYNWVFKLNDLVIYVFLIRELLIVIKDFKYVMNKFYLERIIYDNYYNGIINNKNSILDMRLDKYYYFKDENRYINEKDYIMRCRY